MTPSSQASTYSRDYLKRTIETVRVHRDADNSWPQWANIFADEIERLWGQVDHHAEGWRNEARLRVEDLQDARTLLREWRQYTGLRGRIRASEDPSEYETGRDLLARTDAFVGEESKP